jgi:hypothetical protein
MSGESGDPDVPVEAREGNPTDVGKSSELALDGA